MEVPLEASETYLSVVAFTDLTHSLCLASYVLSTYLLLLALAKARSQRTAATAVKCTMLSTSDKQVPLKEGTTVACRPTEPERFLQENTRKELNQKEEMALC